MELIELLKQKNNVILKELQESEELQEEVKNIIINSNAETSFSWLMDEPNQFSDYQKDQIINYIKVCVDYWYYNDELEKSYHTPDDKIDGYPY